MPDKVNKKLFWFLCKKYNFECNTNWYKYIPEPVLEDDECKLLWEFNINIDQVVEARWPQGA